MRVPILMNTAYNSDETNTLETKMKSPEKRLLCSCCQCYNTTPTIAPTITTNKAEYHNQLQRLRIIPSDHHEKRTISYIDV